MRTRSVQSLLAAILLATPLLVPAGQPLGTAFTYQAYVEFEGAALDGLADFQFSLWDRPDSPDGDGQVGFAVNVGPVDVVNGLLSVELDFGRSALTGGEALWLQVEVLPPAGGEPVVLPRRALTPAPFAVHALTSGDPFPWLLDDRTVFYSAGRVGIGGPGGTSGSGEALTVNGLSAGFGGMNVNVDGDGGEKPYYGYAVNGTQMFYTVYDEEDREWRLVDRNDQISLSVDRDDAHVGIARTDPQSPLHVSGETRFDDLAGTGTRPVLATADGVLIAPSPVPASISAIDSASVAGNAASVASNFTDEEVALRTIDRAPPVTSFYAIPSAAFTPESDDLSFSQSADNLARVHAGSGAMTAAVNLPHGATVRRVDVFYADTSRSQMSLRLERRNFASIEAVAMAEVLSVGDAGDRPGIRAGSDARISRPRPSTTATMPTGSGSSAPRWDGRNLGVSGVRITYLAP